MDNENLLPKEARAVITQNGDRNIAVAHAENINITIAAPSPQDEQACHLVRWGDVEITSAEAKLLDEFLNDIDMIIIMVKHDEIKENMEKLKGKIVLDTQNICKDLKENIYKL